MDDTMTKEQEKFPGADEAANNNTDGLAGTTEGFDCRGAAH
jgi:hypothetical protein